MRIATPGKNARVAVCGAFRWPDGPFVFIWGPKSVDTDLFLQMLIQLEARVKRTGRPIVLVLDNGSAHTSKRSQQELERLRGLLQVFWLPAYSSDKLNDIEGVWSHLKADYFSRMLVRRRENFVPAAVRLLTPLRQPGSLRRMLKPRLRMTMRDNLAAVA